MTERERPLEKSLDSNPDQPPTEAEIALEREPRLPLTSWQQEVSIGLEFGLEGAESIRNRSIATFSRGELACKVGNGYLTNMHLQATSSVQLAC